MDIDDNIKSIVKTAFSRQLDEIKKANGTNALILAVCFVDALSGFWKGYNGKGEGHKKRFAKFTKTFLPDYEEILYAVRTNLVHNFSNISTQLMFIDNTEFTNSFPKVQEILNHKLFNIDVFKNKLQESFFRYFDEIDKLENHQLRINFLIRFNSLGILQENKIAIMRNFKGEIVRHIKDADSLPDIGLKIGIVDHIGYKK